MTLAEFERRAQQAFHEIPPRFREGVTGVRVHPHSEPHLTLPDVYTLGECRSETFPSEYGGAGDVASVVHLYYGSFVRVAEREPEWDWDYEVWETVTHEVQHHLEFLASEDALERRDYVEDQNFARREGVSFDPFFFREGTPVAEHAFEVDGDIFLERVVEPRPRAGGAPLAVQWRGRRVVVPCPDPLGDVHFMSVPVLATGAGEVILVLRRRRGWWATLRALVQQIPLDVQHSEAGVDAG